MNLTVYIYIVLVGLCFISIVVLVIFSILSMKEKQVDYDYMIAKLNQKQVEDLELIKKRNREIDRIEQKIRFYKKKLHMKLFYKKKV